MFKKIEKAFSKVFISSILSSVIFVALGIFLFTKPETTISTISYILGIIIILLGSFAFGKYFQSREDGFKFSFSLLYGVLSFVIGLILIINPTALATLIPFVIGFWMITNSTVKIQYSLNLRQYENKAWIPTFIIGLLTLICGLVMIFNPFEGALVITKMIGLFIIVYSVLDIIEAILININIKKLTNTIIIENK